MIADFLEILLDGRTLGVPALGVREVVRRPAVTPVPGAPAMVAGIMNLRGQLVTAIDLRVRLGLPPAAPDAPAMALLVEQEGAAYALVVDGVGDVVRSERERHETPPPTLDPLWRAAALGVQRGDALTLILDIDSLLTPPTARAA